MAAAAAAEAAGLPESLGRLRGVGWGWGARKEGGEESRSGLPSGPPAERLRNVPPAAAKPVKRRSRRRW